jgi:predicted MFS family arabinose efflux permease
MIMGQREKQVGHGVISGLWNLAFDSGLSFGALSLGLVSQGFGRDAILLVLPVLPACGMLMLVLGHRAQISTAPQAA